MRFSPTPCIGTKPHSSNPVAHQALAVADERDGAGHAAHPQWHDQAPALPELMRPRRGNVGGLHGDDDAVEGRVLEGRRALRRR